MCGVIHPFPQPNWIRLLTLAVFVLVVNGCAALRSAPEASSVLPGPPAAEIEQTVFPAPPGTDVVGELAVMRLEKGDTLPDAARHFSLGVNAISAANPGVDLWAPQAGKTIILPLSFILPDVPRAGIVVNLAAMRLFHFKGEGSSLVVSTYPVGIGTKEKPTPTGQMRVKRKAIRPTWHVPASIAKDHRTKGDPLPAIVPPGPDNPLGECALYLSKTGYLIHGTNKPYSIGLKATNGCLRLYPENVKKLFEEAPLDTPVVIVDHPFLIGRRNGALYLEAHKPDEGAAADELGRLYAALKKIAVESARALDWKKVEEVVAQASGVPVAIDAKDDGAKDAGRLMEIMRPALLRGAPVVPELNTGTWYVLAADVKEQIDATRISAMINHQGPPIPARVITKKNNNGYRVIAGPFADIGEAEEAARRLKIDLEIDGVLVEPVERM